MTTPTSSLIQTVAILAFGKLLFAVQDVIIKEMSGGYAVHQIISIRGLAAIPILLILIRYTKGLAILKVHHPGLHLVRGLLMFTAFTGFYIALSETSLTTATALFFSAPFFITLLSIPLLGEKVGVRRFVSIAIGFAGVIVVLRPDANSITLTALLPIGTAFCYACCQLMVRVYKMTAPSAVMSLYAAVSILVLGCLSGLLLSVTEPSVDQSPGTLFLLRSWSMPSAIDLGLLTLTGITSAFGFMMSSTAYQREQASRVAPFEYVMIIWVTLLSYLVWSELPDIPTLIGIAMIILSGIYVLKREGIVEEKPIAYSGLTRR